MPRSDPTFTDLDLIRFYCRNLDPAEKYQVMRSFADFIKKGAKICPDDPDKRIDPCKWIAYAKELILQCKDIAVWMTKLLPILATIATALHYSTWVGPLGRLLTVLRILVDLIIEAWIFITTILTIVGGLSPLLDFINKFFCTGEEPLPFDYDPPGMNLPPNPAQRRMDDIMTFLDDALNWLTPDYIDNIPPEFWPTY